MDLEVLENTRMSVTGSSFLSLIQNKSMPILDLLVRESIQNSLDACNSDTEYVEVDFEEGEFYNDKLAQELGGLTDELIRKYGEEKRPYLAIRDYNTVGLNGELDTTKVKENEEGNLYKLVYAICKPQERRGAGGSWGMGKTTYFRIGIGIVFYYSRIKIKSSYESRLVASFVYDEKKRKSTDICLENNPCGIAWWGKKPNLKKYTVPLTNEREIQKILKIFNIKPYNNTETGTTIIIPYIDKEKLLADNQTKHRDENNNQIVPYWSNDIATYLKIAIQRWYAPRLNNLMYKNRLSNTLGPYLRSKVNSEGIALDSMVPFFKSLWELYNYASLDTVIPNGILNKEKVHRKEIMLHQGFKDGEVSGTLVFTKLDKKVLKMFAPDNNPDPYVYINNKIHKADENRPVICFTRNPGMIVGYDTDGIWSNKIPASETGTYILGLFVLNSRNRLTIGEKEEYLEEYIRNSEKADHTSWTDWSEGSNKPEIVSKIQNHVKNKIKDHYSSEQKKEVEKTISGLSKFFGEALLPKHGFGTGASLPPKRSSKTKLSKAQKKIQFIVNVAEITYTSEFMIIPMVLDTTSKIKILRTGFDMHIDSENKHFDIYTWENEMNLKSPFSIENCNIYIKTIEGQDINEFATISSEQKLEINEVVFERRTSNKGTWHGLSIYSENPHTLKIEFRLNVRIYNKDVKPYFDFDKKEGNNE